MNKKIIISILVLAALLIAVYLQMNKTEEVNLANNPAATDPLVENSLAVRQEPTVTIINLGVEPRTLLRYAPKVGAKQNKTMRMLMNMKMKSNGQETPAVPMPWIKTAVTAETISQTGNTYQIKATFGPYEIEDTAGASPMAIESLKAQFASLGIGTCQYQISDVGVIDNVSCQLDQAKPELAKMVDQFVQSIKQSVLRLPNEPVGLGAEFSLQSQVEIGMQIIQTANYKITEIKDNGMLAMDVAVKQEAAPQKMSLKDLPPTVSGELVSYAGSGQGFSKDFSMEDLFPTAEMKFKSNSQMLFKNPTEEPKEMLMEYEVEMETQLLPSVDNLK